MTKTFKSFAVLTTIGVLSLTGCGNKSQSNETTNAGSSTSTSNISQTPNSKYTTVVAGSSEFNGVFSPFFGTTAYDRYGYMYVVDTLVNVDRKGSYISNMADYTIEEIKDDNGNVKNTIYTFKLKDGIKFSDGTEVTADDIIFSYKVFLDPTYDGAATIYTTPIVGANEYRYDDPNYEAEILRLKEEAKAITTDEINQFILESCTAEYDKLGADKIVEYIGGLTDLENLDEATKKQKIINAYAEFEKLNNLESYKSSAIDNKYRNLEKEYIKNNLSGENVHVPEIEGIKKIDDKTVQVTIYGVDPKAIDNLGISVAPEHYYGIGKDGTKFKKGDLSMVREKNNSPLGSGPYKFDKFENNVLTLKANEAYYKGTPKTPTIKFQVTALANMLEAVKTGDIDISAPNATLEALDDIEASGLHAELIDTLGYGYIGINAERVPDKNVRKGLMHLMNRKPAIETYYGELASIIERPMSKVSWAYPEDATEYYGFDPNKALNYFKEAGYEQVDKNGKKVLQKEDGSQLKIEVGIAGEGTMNHPSAGILTQMKTELEKMGGILNISDTDSSVFFEKLNSGSWDMFVGAWTATPDPDMYQIYYSEGPSNHYKINNAELDKLIIEARQTLDQNKRKEIYAKALDIIMEEAVEMPVYQRKNMTVFNPEIVNIDSLPEDPSPFYTPFYMFTGEIEQMELK